jgi:hypothetical protein
LDEEGALREIQVTAGLTGWSRGNRLDWPVQPAGKIACILDGLSCPGYLGTPTLLKNNMAASWERRLGWIYETTEVKGHTFWLRLKCTNTVAQDQGMGKWAYNLGASV